MKKFTLFLLAIVFTFACFVSCAKEASEAKHLSAPTDEVAVTKRFYSENVKGLAMEITISGYASESLNESFYVKNGEEFYVQVTVKNPTDRDIPRLASTMCHGSEHDHLHDLLFDIQDGEGNSIAPAWSAEYTCPEMMEVWYIPAGKSASWSFSITPDTKVNEEGYRDFFGTIALAYARWDNGLDTENNLRITTGVFVKVYEFSEQSD